MADYPKLLLAGALILVSAGTPRLSKVAPPETKTACLPSSLNGTAIPRSTS